MDIKFDFDDILIVPEVKTHITSRYKDITLPPKLPLFTAPMDTVVDLNNKYVFVENKINVVFPRTVKYDNGYYVDVFYSFGFEDIDNYYNGKISKDFKGFHQNARVLIDVANGNMQKIVDYTVELKRLRPDITIMVGNIANPETYRWYAKHNCVDFIRVGIGNGCFVAGTKVTTKNGLKNIEDIIVGDDVLTHSGNYKAVVSTQKRTHNEDLIKINDIVCTPNHQFYVLNKKYENAVNDDNIDNLCEWISAKELSENNEYLLVEIPTNYENKTKVQTKNR